MPLAPHDGRLLDALAALIQESLALWDLDGTVTQGSDSLAIDVGRHRLTVERRGDDLFAWRLVEEGARLRPCTSVLDVLRALRSRLLGASPSVRLRCGFVEAAR